MRQFPEYDPLLPSEGQLIVLPFVILKAILGNCLWNWDGLPLFNLIFWNFVFSIRKHHSDNYKFYWRNGIIKWFTGSKGKGWYFLDSILLFIDCFLQLLQCDFISMLQRAVQKLNSVYYKLYCRNCITIDLRGEKGKIRLFPQFCSMAFLN